MRVSYTILISILLIPGPVNPGYERNRTICLTQIPKTHILRKITDNTLQGIVTQLAL